MPSLLRGFLRKPAPRLANDGRQRYEKTDEAIRLAEVLLKQAKKQLRHLASGGRTTVPIPKGFETVHYMELMMSLRTRTSPPNTFLPNTYGVTADFITPNSRAVVFTKL